VSEKIKEGGGKTVAAEGTCNVAERNKKVRLVFTTIYNAWPK
jgi:hypothetical protein